ncbi:ATP-dependent endonuclease [Actinospica durhamensis]|uniref:ATP-dependent endonuclease n=1 Tax=Actinospica durhamensis TaxID=1508375 RepID=A0A941F0R6_9ACTN|nr:ATP-dependent endonuclease [Actinospica durhamensis]
MRAVVLVEGPSDRVALEVLARRGGMDLAARGVRIVSMDGITNIGHFLTRHHADAPDVRVCGLYDDAEERFVRRGLERLGVEVGPEPGRAALAERGFFCCSADLEDELIRALGPAEVVLLVEAQGQARSFRTLRRQPALRDQSLHDQLRRLMSGRSGGKERYAAAMAEAVPWAQVPAPLAGVLAYAATAALPR